MKHHNWSFVVLLLAANVAFAEVVRLSPPVAETASSETFAAAPVEVPDMVPLSLSTLVADAAQLKGQKVVVRTRVASVCQKKGCFFIAQEGADSMRVSFKDYAFFVPTDSSGKTVTLVGEVVERTLSDADAAHFREDLGDGEIQPGKQYEFLASAVRVPK